MPYSLLSHCVRQSNALAGIDFVASRRWGMTVTSEEVLGPALKTDAAVTLTMLQCSSKDEWFDLLDARNEAYVRLCDCVNSCDVQGMFRLHMRASGYCATWLTAPQRTAHACCTARCPYQCFRFAICSALARITRDRWCAPLPPTSRIQKPPRKV